MRQMCILSCALTVVLLGGALWSPAPVAAQEGPPAEDNRFDTKRAQKKGRSGMRDPQVIERRIGELERKLEELRAENPENPQVRTMEKKLDRLRNIKGYMGGRSRDSSAGGAAWRGQRGARKAASQEDIAAFIESRPELQRIFHTRPDGQPASADDTQRMIRRHRRQLERMIRASADGDEQLLGQLVTMAEVQFDIGQKIHRYRQPEQTDMGRAEVRGELRELINRQVELELSLREREITELAERLERQREEVSRDKENIDEIAEKKLERLLSGKSEGKRGGRGGKRPHHRPGRRNLEPTDDE